MDGVIYHNSRLIPGADRFVNSLIQNDIPFLFCTNNSQRTRRDLVMKLKQLGIEVKEKNIFTSAMATARFLAAQNSLGTAYVIGEGGLLQALHLYGYAIVDSAPDYVVVGENRTLTVEAIELAVRLIQKGAKLIATNMDPNCPTEHGLRPGCGAIVSMLEKATGVQAFSVGKPSPIMFHAACDDLQLPPSQVVVIGDTMETDILGGVQLGCRTVLVLSGSMRKEDLTRYAYRPDFVINSVADLVDDSTDALPAAVEEIELATE
ncbi:MAG: HAD-IIA family hydrolase [Anaerolineae bacterium]|nr:HAD-IIA family hydrolase [Anaerolineae bacterium]